MGIELTGTMQVAGAQGTSTATALAGRQGRIVLASLGLAERPMVRDVLGERVWGQDPAPAWERDLSALVSRLRSALARTGVEARIRGVGGSWELVVASELVDVRRARVAAHDLRRHAVRGHHDRVAAASATVLDVVQRPLLPGEQAPWLDDARAELTRLHREALEATARAELERGDVAAARASVIAALDLDPLREPVHRLGMEVELAAGNRAEAVRAYDDLRRLLADELGMDPAPETQALHLQILRGEPTATNSSVAQVAAPSGPGATAAPPGTGQGPDRPRVSYARSGTVNIAYQVVGDGPVDLVFVPGFFSNLELNWDEPHLAAFLRRVAASCRLILFDKRGTGLSDPIPLDAPPPLEVRMDDVRAVLDQVGSERAIVLGFSEGGAMSLLFAATHPDRCAGLVLWGTYARQMRAPDHPWGWTREQGLRRFVRPIQQVGHPPLRWFGTSAVGDPLVEDWWARYCRQAASPGMAIALLRANAGVDLRAVLPAVTSPALVLHRRGDPLVEVGQGRYLAEHLPDARLVEFDGDDHWPWFGDADEVVEAITDFVSDPVGVRDGMTAGTATNSRRGGVLATLVAVRAPAATAVAWSQLVADRRGRVVEVGIADRAASFDGPGRALDVARALVSNHRDASAVVHAGLVDITDGVVTGAASEAVDALLSRARPGQAVLTRTVADLLADWGLALRPAGRRGAAERTDGLDLFEVADRRDDPS